ncbi:MAG TPA: hypothetical protein VHP83_03475 [Aggregatilineaceae bacterium]|nr:hypothetical protein [Aggregatilineaceae bacterium]
MFFLKLFRKKSDPTKAAIDQISNMAAAIKWGNLDEAEQLVNRQGPEMLQAMYQMAQHVCGSPKLQGDISQGVWNTVLSMIRERM